MCCSCHVGLDEQARILDCEFGNAKPLDKQHPGRTGNGMKKGLNNKDRK